MKHPLHLLSALLCLYLGPVVAPFAAQPAAPGAIEGRVFDEGRGEYLERARLVVEGTRLEAFSETGGRYRLTGVPAGEARVRVFFTGLPERTLAVTVRWTERRSPSTSSALRRT